MLHKKTHMTEDYYIDLLIKKWEGSINASELLELEKWLNSSNENATLADEYRKSWKLSEKYDLPIDLNEEKAFDNIMQKIQNKNVTKNNIKTINTKLKFLKPLAIAASLLLISIIAWWTFSNNQNNTIITFNEIKEISLPDGSKVWLNKNSELSFPRHFEGQNRLVKLTGEAFFEVQRDTLKPFIVKTSKALVSVLGTSFNVKANKNIENVAVTVKTGKVKLESIKSKKYILLTPDKKGILNIESDEIIENFDNDLNSLSWKRGLLVFKDTPLAKMIEDLEMNYNVSIQLQNNDLINCLFTGKYSIDKDINIILNDILQVFKMNSVVKLSDKKYLLKGGICQ